MTDTASKEKSVEEWAESLSLSGTTEAASKEEDLLIVSRFDDFFGEQKYYLYEHAPYKRRGGNWKRRTDTIMRSTRRAWVREYDMTVLPGGHMRPKSDSSGPGTAAPLGVITLVLLFFAYMVIYALSV